MIDYSQGKIYTIRHKTDTSSIYVGSTIQSIENRWEQHKYRCDYIQDKEYNKLLYQKIREGTIDNWYIELYENYPCNDKNELIKREGEIIRQLGTLNKEIAGRTKKEWKKENKEQEYQKNYYQKNIEKLKNYQHEYRNNNNKINEIHNCDCGGRFSIKHKSRHNKTKIHQNYILSLNAS
jgi:hypothetical protein